MTNETLSSRRRSVWTRRSRIALIVVVIATGGLFASHLAWKYSGSNQWELAIDKDGVKIYSMKTPGEVLKSFKCVRRVKTTLNQVATAMADTSVEHCTDWNPACSGARTIEPWKDNVSITHYDLKLKFPFSNRDIVFKEIVSQDPQTKVLTVDLIALDGVIPEQKDTVRVTRIHNTWRWTPLDNGEVELELIDVMDPKLPYFLVNQKAKMLHRLMSRVPGLIAKEQYRHQTFASIQERGI